MPCIASSRPTSNSTAPAITASAKRLYLRDPDDNGVELYWDRPKQQWPRQPDGSLAMFTHRLDLEDLLRQRQA